MKHLYTVTGNLLAETTAVYDAVDWNQTQRATKVSFQVGGKGINVAKMARRLGLFSTALSFPGGHTGARCLAWLKAQDFAVAAFPQVAETRQGWVVRSGGVETTFLGTDHPLEEEAWNQGVAFLKKNAHPGDAVALCGSLPGWREALAQPLHAALATMGADVFVAVDSYGKALGDLLQERIDLVKINRQEFAPLVGDVGTVERLATALAEVAARYPNVKRWVVTGGPDAIVARDERGEILTLGAVPTPVVSAVGCGDVLLAGLIHGLVVKGLSLNKALRESLPLASANAASPGIAEFDL